MSEQEREEEKSSVFFVSYEEEKRKKGGRSASARMGRARCHCRVQVCGSLKWEKRREEQQNADTGNTFYTHRKKRNVATLTPGGQLENDATSSYTQRGLKPPSRV